MSRLSVFFGRAWRIVIAAIRTRFPVVWQRSWLWWRIPREGLGGALSGGALFGGGVVAA